MTEATANQLEGRELTITRIFNAPRERVWQAWTNPKQVAQWWGPKHFTNPVCELDLQPGGAIRIDMTSPDGDVYPMGGAFKEIDEPNRLVFTADALDNKSGEVWFQNLNTITFEEHDGKTRLTLHVVVVKVYRPELAAGALDGMEQGWSQSLDKLAEVAEIA